MKRLLALTAAAGLLTLQAVQGQTANPNNSAVTRADAFDPNTGLLEQPARINLDFPGGTPGDLVKAIEKSSGKPLNVVIPIGAADTPLPPLKMRAVTVAELFRALQVASEQTAQQKTTLYGSSRHNEMRMLRYTIQTLDKPPKDDSVWYFSSQTQLEPRGCRFWQLGPYLDTYTVDDITTAIQTGYKMLGEPAPEISFHKDTKLLIAVGEESKLALIGAVLEQLQPARPKDAIDTKRSGEAPKP